MSCFFCPVNNARQCGSSCGLCGCNCPGHIPEPAGRDDYHGDPDHE